MRLIDADSLKRQFEEVRYISAAYGLYPQNLVDMEPTVMVWISVEDRLPEKDIPVLVWVQDGFAYVDRRETETLWSIASLYGANVTHWMSLPEPPEGGDGDG